MALNVSLPKELEARVREHVASGLYGSASEVIREALRLFETYHSVQQSRLTQSERVNDFATPGFINSVCI